MTAHAWPGNGGGYAKVLQPATGRAGKFTYAQHVRRSGDACPGSHGAALVAVARLRGTARPAGLRDRGPLQALERDFDAGKSVWMAFAVPEVCARPRTGSLGPTPPPPGFTSQLACQALPARPVRSGVPCNAGTALSDPELGTGLPPLEQRPPHPGGLVARDRAGLGPPWQRGSIPASPRAGALPKTASSDTLGVCQHEAALAWL